MHVARENAEPSQRVTTVDGQHSARRRCVVAVALRQGQAAVGVQQCDAGSWVVALAVVAFLEGTAAGDSYLGAEWGDGTLEVRCMRSRRRNGWGGGWRGGTLEAAEWLAAKQGMGMVVVALIDGWQRQRIWQLGRIRIRENYYNTCQISMIKIDFYCHYTTSRMYSKISYCDNSKPNNGGIT